MLIKPPFQAKRQSGWPSIADSMPRAH